ncbi:hypothetical protein RDI58_017620 [Solanum bulbocastanum]|uniref:RNase H type-1 domain-containing protein n=1 Tax=Solanum bulbocastanum TaxID=147425 RepID=A0AAN8YA53_SOLBU
MVIHIETAVHQVIRVLYPWLRIQEHKWVDLISTLGKYKPKLHHHIVKWELPMTGSLKCNTDGATKGNPGPSFYGFCIRDHKGDLCYAQAGVLGQTNNVQAEARAILEALRYWVTTVDAEKVLETDSLTMINFIKGVWRVPWEISEIVEEIKTMIFKQGVKIQHIFREGNQLADFLANHAAEIDRKVEYQSFKELPSTGRKIINTDKQQIPTLRIRTRKINHHQA